LEPSSSSSLSLKEEEGAMEVVAWCGGGARHGRWGRAAKERELVVEEELQKREKHAMAMEEEQAMAVEEEEDTMASRLIIVWRETCKRKRERVSSGES
jgi:hypothetical protein